MVHQCLVGCWSVTVSHLQHLTDHIAIWCSHHGMMDMFEDDSNLLIGAFEVQGCMKSLSGSASQHSLHVREQGHQLKCVLILFLQVNNHL